MLKYIKHILLLSVFCAILFGCTTDKLMKKENFSIEKEKASAQPVEPVKPVQPLVMAKEEQISPLKDKIITLTANKASFTEVFAAIAEKAGLDLVVDSRLIAGDDTATPDESLDAGKGKQTPKDHIVLPPVSIAFNQTPLDEALENLASSLHIFYLVNGRTLMVRGTESRTYHLNFLSSQKETKLTVGGDVMNNSSGGYTGGSSASSTGSNQLSGEFSIKDTIPVTTSDICTQIEDTVKVSLTRYGTYSINRALGFLEVNDMRNSLERIDAYIQTIKKYYNSQVLITAKICLASSFYGRSSSFRS